MTTEAQLKATEKYRKKSIKTFLLRFFPDDYDLFEYLQTKPKKAEYLRSLIREDMENNPLPHGREG